MIVSCLRNLSGPKQDTIGIENKEVERQLHDVYANVGLPGNNNGQAD